MSVCQVLVTRKPAAIIETRPGQDWSHLQVCGRPVLADGLCAAHARASRRDPSRERSTLRALAGRAHL